MAIEKQGTVHLVTPGEPSPWFVYLQAKMNDPFVLHYRLVQQIHETSDF
jgi:hypothetical protein